MRKIWPVLLIGFLSMMFAEVFSGASQQWFISGWGILMTFPLYLAHTLFFLWIALRKKKTSLSQLYLFGVLFGLYESWVTKVLWTGYPGSATSMMGKLLGIGIFEFPALVFFWHPIMSFIMPILVFELLTGKCLTSHESIFKKTKKKTFFIILFLILVMPSIANGNKWNLVSTNLSLIGTFILTSGIYFIAKKSNILAFEFKKKNFIWWTIYLAILYVITFFFLLPERIPTTLIPYLSILIFYLIIILLIIKSNKTPISLVEIKNRRELYSTRDLLKFMLVIVLVANLACLAQNIFSVIVIIGYLAFSLLGIYIFLRVSYKVIFNTKVRFKHK